MPAARWSRHNAEHRWCPPIEDSDDFIAWLIDEFDQDRFDLVALTSDYAAFNVLEAAELAGWPMDGLPDAESVRVCLAKDRFAVAMEELGFPTPATATVASVDEAIEAGLRFGYPLVIKPCSHAGVGAERGVVVGSEAELTRDFHLFPIDAKQQTVLRRFPDVARPLVQEMISGQHTEVVSITGVLGPDGDPLAIGHMRKVTQWYGQLGTGAIFEAIDRQPFSDKAIEVVRSVLGSGIFELEVIVDCETGNHWAIDLNPRAFGQIALDVANGRDLPGLWYQSVTGVTLPPLPQRRRRPKRWQQGLQVWAAAANGVAAGPSRLGEIRRFAASQRRPHIGSVFDRRDPLPGLVFGGLILRHPRALFRSVEREA